MPLTRLKNCFSDPQALRGWFCVFVGVVAWLLFGRHADWRSVQFVLSSTTQTDGVLTLAERTGYTTGSREIGRPIFACRFRFDDADGVRHRNVSWSEQEPGRTGTKVLVEYVDTNPQVSRIAGHRSGMLPLWAGAVILFLVYGGGCVLRVGIRKTCMSAEVSTSQ